jgi:centriolar protein POC1
MELDRIHEIKAHSDWIRHARYSPDARMFATCSTDETIKIWSTENYALMHTLEQPGRMKMIAWHPDGSRLLVLCESSIFLWSVQEERALVRIVPDKGERYRAIEWFPDGERFVYGDRDGSLVVCVLHNSGDNGG